MPDPGSGLIKFVHSSDLHLDSPFAGIKGSAPDHVRDTLYDATFKAYHNIIDLCIYEHVDALLIAGDIYDGADRNLRAQLRFIEGLERLDANGIQSFVCHGNHDPLDGWEARLEYPTTCHRFAGDWEAVPLLPDDPDRAVVYGISYPTRDVYENLVKRLEVADGESYNIGLLHANVGGNADHALYAPCSMDDLKGSGLDYWALGHVHTRQVLSADNPTAVYPGNPQGRHPNESGAKGIYLVSVDENGRAALEFRAMDTVRWQTIEVAIDELDTEQELIDDVYKGINAAVQLAGGRALVLRVNLTGRGALHNTLMKRGIVNDLVVQINDEWTNQSPFAWCERIEDRTRARFDRQDRLNGADFIADMLQLRDRSMSESDLRTQLREGIDALFEHRRYGKYVADIAENADEFEAVIEAAEMKAIDLLIGDDI